MTGNLITTARQELDSSPLFAFTSTTSTVSAYDESISKASVHQTFPSSGLMTSTIASNIGQSSPSSRASSNINDDTLSFSTGIPFNENTGDVKVPPSLQSSPIVSPPLELPHHTDDSSHHSNTDEELWINVRIAV